MVTTGPADVGAGGPPDEEPGTAATRVAAALLAVPRSGGGRAAADLADRLSAAAAGALGATGASICALFAPDMSVPVGVSDAAAARAEELQFTAGEGPCWEAYRTESTVVADLTEGPDALRRWPAYARALRLETGYRLVVAVPVRLASGLLVTLNTYEAAPAGGGREGWWAGSARVAAALRQVLDGASPPASAGGAVWLDSPSTLRRAAVWTAEAVLIDVEPRLDHTRALRALRAYSLLTGTTVDDAAAALVEGRLTARRVLGR